LGELLLPETDLFYEGFCLISFDYYLNALNVFNGFSIPDYTYFLIDSVIFIVGIPYLDGDILFTFLCCFFLISFYSFPSYYFLKAECFALLIEL
jgi:hypothetical protein